MSSLNAPRFGKGSWADMKQLRASHVKTRTGSTVKNRGSARAAGRISCCATSQVREKMSNTRPMGQRAAHTFFGV